MHSDHAYVRGTLAYDAELSQRGFTRVCDGERRVTDAEVAELHEKLESAADERPLHAFLADHLHLMLLMEHAHGCRWIRSNPRLGADYVPDFAIVRRDSGGLRRTLVELQSPAANLLIQSGQPSKQLREGIHQIGEWRGWIRRWGENTMASHGFPELGTDFQALIVAGRADARMIDARSDGRIRDLEHEHGLQIRSYDHLVRAAWSMINGCGIDHTLNNWHQYGERW